MAGKGADAGERIFVTKIPPSVTREEIAAHFALFGTTTDVYLPATPGRSGHKGIAFVSYDSAVSLQLAMSSAPHMVQGQEVVVDVAGPRGQPSAYGGEAKGKGKGGPPPVAVAEAQGERLFVTKIAPQLTKDRLSSYFGQFGELTDVYMPAVPGSSSHKGICFVSYADATVMLLVMQQPSHEIDGLPVVVDVAAPRGAQAGGKGGPPPHQKGGYGGYAPAPQQPSPGNPGGGTPVPGRLFLTKVPPDVTKDDLQLYFQQFGQLEDVYVPGNGKGIAFVSFSDPAMTTRVLQSAQHIVKPGSAVTVDQAINRPALGGKGGKSSKGPPGGGFGGGGKGGYCGPPGYAQPGYGGGPSPYGGHPNAYMNPGPTHFGAPPNWGAKGQQKGYSPY
ncbi:unnamed protein product [Polarella glacialis]|uniref:RRM domain-containing protein n=1 Tax=Polarella glacialis TaxID=89957 RepID=A0A813LHM8_POLGL|nr:unnamed protein product [Polarella glacialis]